MKNTKILLAVLSALYLAGCPDNIEPIADGDTQDVAACSGVPIPGAEIYVERTTGAPDTASMELPALTAVCLKVESNTASGWVALDGTDVFGPSDFKNKEVVLHRMAGGLAPEQHTVTAKIASTPKEHYMKVTAYYAMNGLTLGPQLSSTDEALLVGQAFITAHGEFSLLAGWKDASAVDAIPLYSRDGVLEAYEVEIKGAEGEDAGYVVLEAHELRQLLGSASDQGPALSRILKEEYQSVYGEAVEDDDDHTFLWAGQGLMGLEVKLPDDSLRTVEICPECQLTYNSDDRPYVDHEWHGFTLDEWLSDRQERIKAMIDNLLSPQANSTTEEPAAKVGSFLDSGQLAPIYGDTMSSVEHVPHEETIGACAEQDGARAGTLPGFGLLSAYYQVEQNWTTYGVPLGEWCSPGCTPLLSLPPSSWITGPIASVT